LIFFFKKIWQILIHTRQRIDTHCNLGNRSHVDLLVKGDKYNRRTQAYANISGELVLNPANVFNLVSGAYNKVSATITAIAIGQRWVCLL
jgi:hypothetical protein